MRRCKEKSADPRDSHASDACLCEVKLALMFFVLELLHNALHFCGRNKQNTLPPYLLRAPRRCGPSLAYYEHLPKRTVKQRT